MWFILIVIGVILSILNYTPGTYLSGWDTLHPEFNFGEYFQRVVFGIWQAHQGLGAVASQAHAAELPRLFILYPLSFILPDNLLRYFYIFACLIIGPLGIYFFIKQIFKLKNFFAFLGGLFYLLNLVTVQQFYVPLEMFTTQFATLPWLFLLLVKFMDTGKPKFLLLFAIFSFFSAPMSHTPTLWYAYFLAQVLFLTVYTLSKNKEARLRFLKIIIVTLLVNSFWLLPSIYFSINHGEEVINSKIHTLFTEEAFAQNASFGNPADLALFKNFLFSWSIYTGQDKFEPLLNPWIKHLKNPAVTLFGYFFFTVLIIGIFNSLRKKEIFAMPFLSIFLLSSFFLLNVNPPLGFIFKFIQDHIPFFNEAIRFPFTKFSILFIFAGSIYFSFGIKCLITLLGRSRYVSNFLFIFVSFSLIFYTLPAFQGNLIGSRMKVNIPSEYFKMFDWFDKQPNGRIANLPIHSFWGWTYYNWNQASASSPADDLYRHDIYQGAGFLWFGIKQPLLDREFDRWQLYNEQYYREMSYAVYKQDINLFNSTLSKYDISYILLDKSIIAPGADPKVLFFDQIQNLIAQQSSIKKVAQFGNFISVYKIPSRKPVYTLKDYKIISPKYNASDKDFAYQKYGDYITPFSGKDSSSSISFPFRNLTDNQNRFLKDRVKITKDGVSVTVPDELKNIPLELPKFEDLEKSMASDLTVEKIPDNTLKITLFPKFPKSPVPLTTSAQLPIGEKNFLLSINQKSFVLNNLAENTPLSLSTVFLNTNSQNYVSLYQDKDDIAITPDFSTLNFSLDSCSLISKGVFGINNRGNNLSLTAKNSDLCMITPLPQLAKGYEKLQGDEILLGIKFNLSQTSNSSLCMANLKNGSCIDYGLRSGNFIFFEVKKEDVNNLGMKIFMEASESKQGEKSSYTDILVTLKKPLFVVKFSKDVLKLSLDYLKTINDQAINIAFPGSEQYNRDVTNLPKTNGDCQTNQGPLAPKKQIVKQEFKNYIRYTAEEGSFCDHFSYQNLPQDQAYVIAIQSRNIKGLPIRLCVTNQTSKRCDLYTHLSVSSEFTQDIFLLPPMSNENHPGSGFDININTLGIKNVPSINDLSSIYIIPFPYYWLSQFEIKNQENGLKNEVLVSSEAYEKGWKAYNIKSSNFLTSVFPFVFGKELKNHVLVNNWANGWILSENSKSSPITIVFLPQYLEYLGFILLAGTFLFLSIKLKNEHNAT